MSNACVTCLVLLAVGLCSSSNTTTTVLPLTPSRNVTHSTKLPGNFTVETTTVEEEVIVDGISSGRNRTVNVTNVNGTQVIQVGETQSNPDGGIISYFKTLIKSKSALGEKCMVQEDCEGRETICQDRTCQCQEGYVAAIDRWHCLAVVKAIGDECLQDAQCYTGLDLKEGDAFCTSFRCVCGTDTIYRNGTCIRSIYLGDKCVSDSECLTGNSRCVQGVCACPKDMIASADNVHCLPALKTLEKSNCTQDEQCQQLMGDYSICNEKKCQCKPRNHFNSTMCVPDLKLGESCTKTSDCQSSQEFETKDRRECIKRKCTCASGYSEVIDEDICISGARKLLNGYVMMFSMLVVIMLSGTSSV